MDKNKTRFTGVDVWKASFSDIQVKAIKALYAQCTGTPGKELRFIKLRNMVDHLRKLDDPNYVPVKLPLTR